MEFLKIILCLCWFASVKATIIDDAACDENNRLRSLHGTPPLKVSQELCDKAAEHAKMMALQHDVIKMNVNGQYSVNLCTVITDPLSCLGYWYRYQAYYNYNDPVYTPRAESFTNMIWAASTEMGFGQYRDALGNYYVVAMYSPPAIGDFAKNVPPLQPGASAEYPDDTHTTETTTTSKAGKIAVPINAMAISILFGLFKLTC